VSHRIRRELIGPVWVSVAISVSVNSYHSRFADAKHALWRIFDAYAYWIAGGKVNPVQGSLNVWQALIEFSNDIRIRGYAEADALNRPSESLVRP